MDDLPLQIGHVDRVEIGKMQLTHTRGGQIQRNRGAQATQAYDQRLALLETQLPFYIDLRQQNLPAVAQQLRIAQHGRCPSVTRSCPPRSRWLSTDMKPCSVSSDLTAGA